MGILVSEHNDTLDTIMQFPCAISVKALGKNSKDFDSHVVSLLRPLCTDLAEGCVSTRPSKNNNFLAVTVRVTVQDRAHADRIYQALTDDDLVLMAI